VKRLVAGIALALSCCSGARGLYLQEAEAIAVAGELNPRTVQAGGLNLLSYERLGGRNGSPGNGGILTIYIEGDGRAWKTPWQPSTDPTPTDPVGLRLAAADPARPLVYLARPCQFETSAGCADNRFWTSARFSPEIVNSYQQLIDNALQRSGSKEVGLIGYSGGGALAALIAERRSDVAWLVTVAANLDLAEWVRRQSLAPLAQSLDPAEDAGAIAHLPQIHLTGANDNVVPPAVVDSFLRHFPPSVTARMVIVPGFDHACCWAEAWPRLLASLDIRR
jgi:pimeloyl-ACP methyl ester carboxylesterase